MGPIKRLIAVTVQMCMAVHEVNTKGNKMANTPVPPEMQEKAKDL